MNQPFPNGFCVKYYHPSPNIFHPTTEAENTGAIFMVSCGEAAGKLRGSCGEVTSAIGLERHVFESFHMEGLKGVIISYDILSRR